MKIQNKILFFAIMGFLLGSNTLCADIIYTNIIGATVGSDGYCTLDGLHVGFADSYSRFGIGIGLGSVLFPISGNELELTKLSSRSSGSSLFKTNQWELISFLPVEIYFIPIMWNKTVINSGVFNSFGYGNDPVGNIFLYSRFIPFSKLQVDSMESGISSFKEFYEYGIGISFGEYIMFKIGNRHISFSPYTFEGDNKYKFTGLQKDSFYAGLNIYFGQWAAESTAESGFIPWIKGTVNNVVVDPYKNAKKRKRNSIFESIATKNNEQLISLLNKGINPNIKDDSGKSALVYAIDHDNADAMKILIAKGASVNEKGPGGKTPLIYTIKANKPPLIQLLLENNIFINDKNDQGQTALYYAIDNNNIDFVKALIEKGANPNVKDNQELTPLSYSKDLIMSKYLIEKGADINCKDSSGKSLLLKAIEKDDKDTANLLIQSGIDISIKDNNGEDALFYATRKGSEDLTRLLLKSKADVNSLNIKGKTPLFFAKNIIIFQLLLDNGANINKQDQDGNSALMEAIKNNNVSIAALMLKKGVDINLKNNLGENADELSKANDRVRGLFLKRYGSGKPFDFSLTKMPRDFEGDNIELIYNKLSQPVPDKDEFETTEEYRKRVQTMANDDFISLFTSGIIESKYDADNKVLNIPTYVNEAKKDRVIKYKINESFYEGKNAFNASTIVTCKKQIFYNISISQDIPFSQDIPEELIIKMKAEEAKRNKDSLSLIYICSTKTDKNELAYEKISHIKPTFQDPTEWETIEYYINIELLDIWIFNQASGDIIYKYSQNN